MARSLTHSVAFRVTEGEWRVSSIYSEKTKDQRSAAR
jgi:hypothetical protein